MKNHIRTLSVLLLLASFTGCSEQNVEKVKWKVGELPDGSILVPSNQLLRPAGFQVYLPGRPVDLVLTKDEKYLVVKNRTDLDLIRITDRTIIQSFPYGRSGASFTGLNIAPDEVGRAHV